LTGGHLVSARGHESLGELWTSVAVNGSVIQLDSNENPNGPGPRVLEAIRTAFPVIRRYPYDEAAALASALARFHGVPSGGVVLGCGSAEILRMTLQAFTSATRPLVAPAPTYETPARYAAAFGVPLQAVDVNGALALDLPTMLARARGAGVVYVCNPNNPTGSILPASAVNILLERLAVESPQTVVLVDEAYCEYVDDGAYKTSVPLTLRYKNVIVSRTFSKVYGMAGLRCGYGVGHPDSVAKMMPFRLATSVNQLALAAALTAVSDKEFVERERTLNREARAYTRRTFEQLGYSVAPSEANFLFVDLREEARFFRDACQRSGVLVGRAFPPLSTYARISIGTMDEMQRASAVFTRVLRGAAVAPRG
jgi:histidinol-phosphate aminotransferase